MPSSGLYRLKAGVLPPGTCFGTPQQLLELYAAHLTVSVPDSESQFNFGTVTPPADRRGIPWFRLDASGRPKGWYYFYGGAWRKAAVGVVGEIRMYEGTDADFDETGKGKIDTEMDGWALCNGNNGTVDFRNKFIIVAQERTGGAWKTNVDGGLESTGGEALHKVSFDDLPQIQNQKLGTHRTDYPLVIRADSLANNAANVLSLPQDPLPLPPYYALAYIKWINYI